MNFVVAGYELDAYWAEERFVVELDLFETHGTRASFEEDRLRQEELKLAGVEMIRVTGPRLKREPEIVDRAGQDAAGAAPPASGVSCSMS